MISPAMKPCDEYLGEDSLEDDVFYQNQNRETSPEFFEVSFSGRNSLSSISELANDEEVARFMAFDRRASAVQDPRFDLFCKWLDTQNGNKAGDVQIGTEQQIVDSDLSQSGDEFHDAEREQSPPECIKEMLIVTDKNTSAMVIPTISVPGRTPEKEIMTSPEPIQIDSGSLMNINDPVKLMRRKLHSPKKGRAPEPPPKSSDDLPKSVEKTQPDPAKIHLETII